MRVKRIVILNRVFFILRNIRYYNTCNIGWIKSSGCDMVDSSLFWLSAMRLICAFLFCLLLPICGFSQTSETPFATAEVEVNLPIPDGNSSLQSTITIPGSGLLQDLRIALRIQHDAVQDLRISLKNPTGQTVLLHNQSPSSMNPFNPVYETVTPSETTLTFLHNINAHGTWTLVIEDLVPGNAGILESWGMMVSPVSLLDPLPPTPVPVIPGMEFNTVYSEIISASASSIVCHDINADRIDDVLVLSESGNSIFVYTSNGTTLNPLQTLSMTAPKKIAIHDLNGDGLLDIVAAAAVSSGQSTLITAFIAAPEGGYASGFTADLQTQLQSLEVFDANHDSIPDIIVGGIPLWLEGNGDGSFKPQEEYVLLGREFLSSADINQDGIKDIVVQINRGGTSQNNDPYVILLHNDSLLPLIQSDGTKIELKGIFLQSGVATTRIPGRNEMIILSRSQETEPVQLFHTIQTDSSGSVLAVESRLAPNTIIPPFSTFDINGDGLDEFLFTTTGGVISFQKNPETIGGTSNTLVSNPNITHVCAGLLFGDGSVGLAAVTKNQELLLMQSNLGERPVPPQFITPSPTPTSALFITPTPTPSPPVLINTPTPVPPLQRNPDLNNDGKVDKFDLLLLIQSWGLVNQ